MHPLAVLLCQERGLLGLDDHLENRLPGDPPDKRETTVRQLLTYTSGLGRACASEGQRDRATAVARVLAEPVVARPGSGFHHSNSNYELAVALVEVATGRDYQSFVREELFEPAGLEDTGFAGDRWAYEVGRARDPTPARLGARSWGSEGVYSTASDLARWVSAVHAGQILAPASVEALFAGGPPIQEG